MKFTVMTLFPEMVDQVLSASVIGRAREKKLIEVQCMNIRDYSTDKHRRVDDYPFGGGGGMIMQCQPVYECYADLLKTTAQKPYTVYLSPRGSVLTQKKAKQLSEIPHLALLCGHYEGIDERAMEQMDCELSIGDYVLTGGELPAMVLIDCVSRFIPGVLGSSVSAEEESFSTGLLEYPQYTRPADYRGMAVPEVLLSGNHAHIARWRREESLKLTWRRRPELIAALDEAELDKRDREFLARLKNQEK